jgi:branched-chain amino acid transport system ATP-binding protein
MSFVKFAECHQDHAKTVSLLSVDKISKSIQGRHGVSNFSLNIGDGEIVGLIGRKGSGKTTVVDLISGHLAPNSGRIYFAGQDVTELPTDRRQQCGLARSVEATGVFPDFTLTENVAFGGDARRKPLFPRKGGKSSDSEARDLLSLIGLAHYAESPAGALSMSQRRVLGIAAALASKPSLLLLDMEPSDSYHDRVRIASLLARVVGSGISVLVTSHQMCPIIAMCDRAALIDDGRIIDEGPPARIIRKTALIRSYLSRMQQRICYGCAAISSQATRIV